MQLVIMFVLKPLQLVIMFVLKRQVDRRQILPALIIKMLTCVSEILGPIDEMTSLRQMTSKIRIKLYVV